MTRKEWRSLLSLATRRFRDSDLTMSTMATLHALLGASFGFSLVYSSILGLNTTAPSYRLITAIPGWPLTVGGVFLVLGIGQLWARLGKDRYGWSSLFFTSASVAMGLYAALYLVGTATADTRTTILGPQVTYFVLAAVYAVHAVHDAAQWLNERG